MARIPGLYDADPIRRAANSISSHVGVVSVKTTVRNRPRTLHAPCRIECTGQPRCAGWSAQAATRATVVRV